MIREARQAIIGVILLSAACGPTGPPANIEATVQARVEATSVARLAAAAPTFQPRSTQTPTPTATLSPTPVAPTPTGTPPPSPSPTPLRTATPTATPTWTPLPRDTPRPTPDLRIIPDLAYIRVTTQPYTDDADAESDGIDVSLGFYDSKSRRIQFSGSSFDVTVNMYWYTRYPPVYQEQATLSYTHDVFGRLLRIPYNRILKRPPRLSSSTNPILEVLVSTEVQGEFESVFRLASWPRTPTDRGSTALGEAARELVRMQNENPTPRPTPDFLGVGR